MSEVVTFRVSKSLKTRMNRLRHVNWSELLRRTLEDSVEEEEKRVAPERDPEKMRRGVEEMDRVAKISKGSGWAGAEEVIRWRRERYSYSTQA